MKNYFKKYGLLIYIFIATILFVTRIVNFAGQYGGVEHDSGWYMGVARNLAERGIYASYTNTIVQEGTGAYPSIHGRFSVQDKDGFIYFPAGVTVGPGYVLPEALIIKIFGDGFWQYRAWPLISFAGLLVLLFYLVFLAGGWIALLLLQLWLWAVPQLYITYAYEAFSEHTAIFYSLLAFWLFYQATKSNRQFLLMMLAGSGVSLAILTKNLYALTFMGFLPAFFIQLLQQRHRLAALVGKWIFFAIGVTLPLIIFNLYRSYYLVSRFGQSGLEAVNKDIDIVFQSSGSGFTTLTYYQPDWVFIAKKSTVWAEIALSQPSLVWLFLALLPLLFWKVFRKFWLTNSLFYGAALASLVWFLFISPTGWTRHAWQGLPLTMALITISAGLLLKNISRQKYTYLLSILIFMVSIIFLFRSDKLNFSATFNQADINHWRQTRYQRSLQGLPSTPIFSLADQKQTINFFSKNIGPNDRIYYLQGLLVAEMSPLVDKIFYPYDRYMNNNYQNPDGGNSYLIFGPYQMGPESLVNNNYLSSAMQNYCQQVVFVNPSYVLCLLK